MRTRPAERRRPDQLGLEAPARVECRVGEPQCVIVVVATQGDVGGRDAGRCVRRTQVQQQVREQHELLGTDVPPPPHRGHQAIAHVVPGRR